jgi:Fe-S cluster assembly iron-binding protein IscA
MFTVSEKASEMIKQIIKDSKEPSHIRIMISGGG